MKRYMPLLLAIIIILFVAGCSSDNDTPVSKTGLHMSTVITITAYGDNAEETLDQAFDEIIRLESILSKTLEGSDIYEINEAAGSDVAQLTSETVNVITESLRYYELSKGYFDFSIGPLVDLWGIGTDHAMVPSDDDLSKAISKIDLDSLIFNGDSAGLPEAGMALDVGGIAKGYIADMVADIIRNSDCTGAVINLGGNVMTIGQKPDGSKWKVGLQDPFQTTGSYMEVVEVGEMSVVTSGPYERNFEENDVVYHHILNPFTGYPIENDIASVTIISKKSIDGDGLSTSVFAMGKTDGLALVESLDNTECYIVFEDGTILMSTGFSAYLKD